MAKNRRQLKGLTTRALDLLMRYDWPGNVRELENTIERAVILTRGDMIGPEALPEAIYVAGSSAGPLAREPGAGRSLKEVEKEMILRTLEDTDGNRTQAAIILGISRRSLQMKLKEYGMTPGNDRREGVSWNQE
jgi:two-component system response regulator HydG